MRHGSFGLLLASLAFSACSSGSEATDSGEETAGGAGGTGGTEVPSDFDAQCGDGECSGLAGDTCEACPGDCGICPPPVCGDRKCEDQRGENCDTCATDCGQCPVCDLAPTCTTAGAAPTDVTPFSDCDNAGKPNPTRYSCGTELDVNVADTDCMDPELRLRVTQIKITKKGGDEQKLYCFITAHDGKHSEFTALAPSKVKGGKGGVGGFWEEPQDTRINYDMAQGTFWGQGNLYQTMANVEITYKCYLGSDETFKNTMSAITDAAGEVGKGMGPYSWVFGTVSVVTGAISGIIGTPGDETYTDVVQVIASGALLDFTNGRSWQIKNSGLEDDGEIVMDVEAWGCAKAVPGGRK